MRELQATRITFLRSRHSPRSVFVGENPDVHSIDQLRRWARRGVLFVVIDPETGQDVTRVVLA
jgi:hypothetical protein